MSEERRQQTRVQWVSPGKIELGDGSPDLICLVHDLSNGGAKLSSVVSENLPDIFKLCLAPSRGSARECRAVWRSKRSVGVALLVPFTVGHQAEEVRQQA